jgi:biotin synthase
MILPGITQGLANPDPLTHQIVRLIDKLADKHTLTPAEYLFLLDHIGLTELPYLCSQARALTDKVYGKHVFFRGLIELSNICSQGCYYCGLQSNNQNVHRYRMDKEQILSTVKVGYDLGFRSFVWQGGEDPFFTDEFLCDLLKEFKASCPDCVVTLSIGERSRASYQALYDAGLDRYLLRHETASPELYAKLHPASMAWQNRMRCLHDLKEIGYWVGAGFLINPPYQTNADLLLDLLFVEAFQPHMCGIGPFIPHPETRFNEEKNGSSDQTIALLALVRLIVPEVLLPSTTALGTVDPNGRAKGFGAGGMVVMPNLTPPEIRKFYEIYAEKKNWGDEAAENVRKSIASVEAAGYVASLTRGDHASYKEK